MWHISGLSINCQEMKCQFLSCLVCWRAMKEHYLQSLPAWKELWTESQAVDSKPSPSQLRPRPWIRISWAITVNEKVGNDDLHGFPNSSVGKESACNAGDPSTIPDSRRSAGEGIGYPLQYSWASIMAQLVKNPPTIRETWVQSLGREDRLEKAKATHSSILAWRIPWTI